MSQQIELNLHNSRRELNPEYNDGISFTPATIRFKLAFSTTVRFYTICPDWTTRQLKNFIRPYVTVDFGLENFDIVEKAEPKPLKIYINSEGGEIFAAKRSCKSSWNSNSFNPFSLYILLLSLLALLEDDCFALDVVVVEDVIFGIPGSNTLVSAFVEVVEVVEVVEGEDAVVVEDDAVVVEEDGSDGGVEPSPTLAAYV